MPPENQFQTPELPKPKSKNTFLVVVLIAALVIAATATAYFVVGGKGKREAVTEPKTETEKTAADNSGWQTYRNEEYSFELRYLSQWTVEEKEYTSRNPKDVSVITAVDKGVHFEREGYSVGVTVYEPGSAARPKNPISYQPVKNIEDWIVYQGEILPNIFLARNKRPGLTDVGNIPYFTVVPLLKESASAYKHLGIGVEYKENLFIIGGGFPKELSYVPGTPKFNVLLEGADVKIIDEVDKILSSFKFIDTNKDKTADWQTYRNEKFGFELKLPSEFNKKREKLPQPDSDWYNVAFDKNDYSFSILVEPIARLSFFTKDKITGDLEQVAEIIDRRDTYGSVITRTETKVAGVPALLQDGYTLAYVGGFVHLNTLFLLKDNFVSLTLTSKRNDGGKVKDEFFVKERLTQDFRDLNDQILSTFKFVDTNKYETTTPQAKSAETLPKFYKFVNFEVESAEPIGYASFDIEFLSDKSTAGLFTPYFDNSPRAFVDQKYFLGVEAPAFKEHIFPGGTSVMEASLPGFSYQKSKHVISFRLDAFGEGIAKAKINNLKLGLIDMEVVEKMKKAEADGDQLLWQKLFSQVIIFKDINEFFTGKIFSNLKELSLNTITELYFEAEPQN